jgi:hypothetical protein
MSTTTVEVALQEQQELQSAVETFGPSADDAIVQAKQKWNDPPINKWRLLATFASFAVVGASDGVYGVRSPCTVKRKYRLMIFFFSQVLVPYVCREPSPFHVSYKLTLSSFAKTISCLPPWSR